MPTKPNMNFSGGPNTGGNIGVMQSANQAARIKANAEKDSGILAVAGTVGDWADEMMREERQKRLEARAEGRTLAKEGRAKSALDESREYGLSEEERKRKLKQDPTTPEGMQFKSELDRSAAQTEQAKSAARKNDRWVAASSSTNKIDVKPSGLYLNGQELTIGQAKFFQNDFKEVDQDLARDERFQAISDVVKTIDEETGLVGTTWTTTNDAEKFVKLAINSPDKAKKKDAKAYKLVFDALQANPVFGSTQEFITGTYGSGQLAPPASTKRTKEQLMAEIAAKKKAMGIK